MIVVIGVGASGLCQYLKARKLDAVPEPDGERVPSLTKLLIDSPEITDIVLTDGAEKNWSLGHILAAAKQLQGRGKLVLIGTHKQLPALLHAVPDKDALSALLQNTAKPKSDGTTETHSHPKVPAALETEICPLNIPQGKILFVGVVGAQHRIGCTTTAISLWHYCKRLGFDPAIVMGQEDLARLVTPMEVEEISGGYLVEGIPFTNSTALSYDCYILDIGIRNIQTAKELTDCLVLVAGSKPWELSHTVAALRAVGAESAVLLSFSGLADGKALMPLLGKRAAAVLPWMPNLWKPSPSALAIYDTLLRPKLEQALAKEPEQIQLAKE